MSNKLREEIDNIKERRKSYENILNNLKEKRQKLFENNNYKFEHEWLISRYTGQVDELGLIITRLELL
jgi:FtsZ-binding cell division protein ZapB